MIRPLLVLGLVLAAAGAGAREVWRQDEISVDVSGTARELVLWSRGTSSDRFAAAAAADASCAFAASFHSCGAFREVNEAEELISLTRLEGRVELSLPHDVMAVAVYDHELSVGSLRTLEADLGGGLASERFADLEWTVADARHQRWEHSFYRLYLDWDTERAGVTIGRQRVPWGVGRLWNPIDRFNAVGPLAIQGDRSGGVDAVNLRWRFSEVVALQAVCAATERADDRSYAARLHGVARDVDYGVVAGVFEEALALGFDLAGNLGDSAGRAEVVWTRSSREIRPVGSGRQRDLPDFWQVVISIDRLFDVWNGLYVLAEHLYNGNALGFGAGRPGGLLPFFAETDVAPPGVDPGLGPFVTSVSGDRFGGSRVVTRGEQLTGLQLGTDVTPEVRASFLVLYDWQGRSAAFVPSLGWNVVDWLELTLAGQLFAGPRRSEFGDQPHTGYLVVDLFF